MPMERAWDLCVQLNQGHVPPQCYRRRARQGEYLEKPTWTLPLPLPARQGSSLMIYS